MIIYEIKLPKKEDPDEFARFMKDEYFPAIHKGTTRIGQVLKLELLQGQNETEGNETMHDFFLHTYWSGVSGGDFRVDNNEVEKKFKKYGAHLKRLGNFDEIATWKGNTE